MPVQVEVVKEVLVTRLLSAVLEREPPRPVEAVATALGAGIEIPACDGGPLDRRMRGIGYLSRIVERDMFDAARRPMDGLADELRKAGAGVGWVDAVIGRCAALAREETLPRPAPTDPHAVLWRVPGPGGHVRHFVVAAAIAEVLSDPPRAKLPRGIDAGELKRSWTYGFVVRCCEEAFPPERMSEVNTIGQ